jgi:hypothetical protein
MTLRTLELFPQALQAGSAHRLFTYAEILRMSAQGALQALDNRAAAYGQRGIVSHELKEWKESINRLRTSTYGDLLKIAAENGYPKSWTDSFFRAQTREKKGEPGTETADANG